MNQFAIANDNGTPSLDSDPVCLIGIDYDEFKPETYRGCYVIVSEAGQEVERLTFPSWDGAAAFVASTGYRALTLSSVDDFAADSAAASSH